MAVALRRWCQPNHLHETQGTLRSATTWAMALIAWPKMSHQYPSPFHAYLHSIAREIAAGYAMHARTHSPRTSFAACPLVHRSHWAPQRSALHT